MDLVFAVVFFLGCLRLLHAVLPLPVHSLLLPSLLLTLIGYPVLKALIYELLRPFFLLADSQLSAYLLLAVVLLAVLVLAFRLRRGGSLFGRDPFGHF